ncbi:MAG TPA: hypothetical protein VFN36_00325 [Solirubrobacteraceae bacterium]|nr:hypothetical protein [Solirubrobacteraceae bacterium]
MAAPTRDDATLMIQIAQWMATSGVNETMPALWASDFDPETADPQSAPVRLALGVFETIGTLVKHDLLSFELVKDWMWLEGIWSRVGPAALRMRAEAGEPRLYENFEALATRA